MKYPSNGPVGQGFSTAHQALDLGNKDWFNTPVVAPHAGTVTAAGQMGSGTNDAGLAVDVNGGRFVSRMGHLNSISVRPGQAVAEGQEIGRMGYTGYTQPDNNIYGTHVHWVLWENGTRVDGRKYITSAPSTGGTEMFQNDNEVKQAYLMLRGNEGTAGERAGWIGKSKQTFFQVAKAEADSYRKQLADVKTALANEQNKPPKEVVKIVEKIVDRPVEVIKEVKVGEDEAIKGFFSRLVDKLIFWSKK